MARKTSAKKTPVTVKKIKIEEIVTDTHHSVLQKAVRAYHRSETAHYVERLDETINQHNYQMSEWEVEQLNEFFEKFAAKYNSPLAKALK